MVRFILAVISIMIISCGNKRSQEPVAPYPYQSEEVNFISPDDDVVLSATLTTPSADKNIAVILVSGSGPNDRDCNNQFGHRPFLVLADYLTRQGIAVLRYDERGVGKSGGDYRAATYENLIADVAGGVNYLRENGFRKVGIIGHSEGGGIAPLVSLRTKTDFLVLMAADNATAGETLLYQTEAHLKNMGADKKVSREILANIDSLLSILKTTSDPDSAKVKMEKLIEEKEKTASEEVKSVSRKLGDPHQLIHGFLDPKFIYRLHHDPKNALGKVRVPVLIIYGDEDHAVDAGTNLPLMKKALDSTSYEVKIFPGLGHLFMPSKGVPMEKLHEVEETIAPEVLKTMGDWILRHTNK